MDDYWRLENGSYSGSHEEGDDPPVEDSPEGVDCEEDGEGPIRDGPKGPGHEKDGDRSVEDAGVQMCER